MDATILKKLIKDIQNMDTEVQQDKVVTSVEYKIPSLDLLKEDVGNAGQSTLDAIELEKKLAEYGFEGKVENIHKGPLITRYEIRLAKGVRISQVKSVAEDLAIALMSDRIRIQAPIPGTSLVGIEVANEKFATVGLRKVIAAVQEQTKMELPIGVGVDIVGNPKVVDLAKMPHLLIAGQTGSGKSVGLNVIILSLLYTKTPDECKLILVDPKRVEMTSYADLPHLLRPVVTDPQDSIDVFKDLIVEMENRFKVLSEHKVRNIVSYNELELEKMPYIVCVVDEMADLMMTAGKEVETYVVRLAQLARAVGIHIIVATQKPIVKVITGLIKSNLPSRIAYQVTSGMDSRVVIDNVSAEKLIGRGDLLMQYPGVSDPERYHGAWVSDGEIEAVCNSFKN